MPADEVILAELLALNLDKESKFNLQTAIRKIEGT